MKEELVKAAVAAMENAYVKYSHFPVGAALRLKDGRIVTGANIENASFGLTNCAERSALFAAYSQGMRKEDILEMAVATKNKSFVTPCGACRQVMSELVGPDIAVHLVNKNHEVKTLKNEELLPYAFNEEELPR